MINLPLSLDLLSTHIGVRSCVSPLTRPCKVCTGSELLSKWWLTVASVLFGVGRCRVSAISLCRCARLIGPARKLNVLVPKVPTVALRSLHVATTVIGSKGQCRRTRRISLRLALLGRCTLARYRLNAL